MSDQLRSNRICLALQGGGAHAAFTWGALDQLLLHEDLQIDAISATSGGAIQAAVIAQGMMEGGYDGARAKLLAFWHKMRVAVSMLPIRMNVVDKMLSHVGMEMSTTSLALDYITKIFSPYQFNLIDLNPLRGIVEEMVDFDRLRQHSPVALYINATHAKTGKSRVFTHQELSLDAVMASACLPLMVKTVMVNDEPYWDGSFSACPALSALVNGGHSRDIVLVRVHPACVDDVPVTAADILDRSMEIGFGAVLAQEMKTVELYNQMIKAGHLQDQQALVHIIESDDMLASLGRASKLNTDWDFLVHLHDIGVQAATDWLAKSARQAA